MSTTAFHAGGAHIYLVVFPDIGVWKIGKAKESRGSTNLATQLRAANRAVIRHADEVRARHRQGENVLYPGCSERWVVDLCVSAGGRLGHVDWGTAERVEHTAAAWLQGRLEAIPAWVGALEYLMTPYEPPMTRADWPTLLRDSVRFGLDLVGYDRDQIGEPRPV